MGYRAHVARKYDVQYGVDLFMREFDAVINTLKENPIYENVVWWNSESEDEYELNKELLLKAKDDDTIPEEIRKLINEILDSSDPALDYVRVDFF